MPLTTSQSATARAAEVIARCQALAHFSEDPGTLRRTFLSPPMRDCHGTITEWLKLLGLSTTIDAAGNLRAIYPCGETPMAPRLLIGSHLDTVPNAGAYDGPLGVVLGIALLEELRSRKLHLPFEIELVGFSEEEGVRFGVPFLGSRGLIGTLDEDLLSRVDRSGVSVREAIKNFDLDPAQLPDAHFHDNVLAYLEFHIEQGPVLECLGLPLAAVEAIVGQTRLELAFTGQSNHAGTTPMGLRRDALAAAAEWMVGVEKEAQHSAGMVATVGSIQAHPGAANVIPGEVRLSLDLRHSSDETRGESTRRLTAQAREIATRRGLSLRADTLLDQSAVAMDPFLVAQIESAISAVGCAAHRMASGAGHDAMILAQKIPSAMVFLRSPGGISHDPAESVLLEDVAHAIDCGSCLLQRLAASPEFLRSQRTPRA